MFENQNSNHTNQTHDKQVDHNRILIVDDNPSIHADFRKILTSSTRMDGQDAMDLFLGADEESDNVAQYDLAYALQGREGVEKARQALQNDKPFSLAFVDMRMPPGWDGMRTIQELWKVDKDLQIVICTAFSDHSWSDLQQVFGNTDQMLILKKPFDCIEVSQLAVAMTEKWRVGRQLQRILREAVVSSQAKSQFVATMSHELRTPLNGILGMTELLADTRLTYQQQTYLEACRSSGEALTSIIGNILNLSRIEAGHLDISLKPTCLLTLAEGVTQALGMGIAKANSKVDLICFADPGIPELLMADECKLRQILFNLVGNAAKFTDRGSITVSANCVQLASQSVRVKFCVADTGIGIPQDYVPTLFDAFTQVDNSDSRRYSGTGLGLSITKQLVELLGGGIRVVTSLGKGSRFEFELEFERCESSGENSGQSLGSLQGLRVGICGFSKETAVAVHQMLSPLNITSEPLNVLGPDIEVPNLEELDLLLIDYANDREALESMLGTINHCQTKSELRVVPVCHPGNELAVTPKSGVRLLRSLTKPLCQSKIIKTLLTSTAVRSGNPNPPTTVAPKENSRPRLAGLKILLVEDNEINQMFAKCLFESGGASCEICSNGKQAVDRVIQSNRFDVIFMDCQMPVMDGFEATALIRDCIEQGLIQPVPIIALTANAGSSTRDEFQNAGMSDFMSKPFDLDDVVDTLQKLKLLKSVTRQEFDHAARQVEKTSFASRS